MKFSQFTFKQYELVFVGTPDIATAKRITKEWYEKLCPKVTYREIKRQGSSLQPTNLDVLWNEPVNDKVNIERNVDLNSHVVLATEVQQFHRKFALEKEIDGLFNFGISVLEEKDLYPQVGDFIIQDEIVHEIMRVYISPENRWQHTNFPMHVSCATTIYRMGDGVNTTTDNPKL